MEQEVNLCDEVEAVMEFTYLGDWVSAGRGRDAAVTATKRCQWVELMECGELMYGRRFPLKLEGADYLSYIRPAIQYGSEAWCLKESEMGILRRRVRSMVRAMCGVQLKDRKRSEELLLMLGMNETINQLSMANSIRWYDYVLRREDGRVLRGALHFEVEDQRKKGRQKRR